MTSVAGLSCLRKLACNPPRPIRLSFSPDSDDIFMFWALLNGNCDREGLSFIADRADTETLNTRAEESNVVETRT